MMMTIYVPPAIADGTASSTSSSSSASGDPAAPAINAQTAVVIDADTGDVLYQKDMHRQMYPASITKIMTGLLVAEMGDTGDVVTISKDIGNSQGKSVSCIGLEPGEQITVDSLMYTMFLASANDSAYALAEHIGGTVDSFVNLMNERARQLGATDTHFSNPNGLPDKNNYTSAYDMALIARQAVVNTTVLKYFGAVRQTIPADNVIKNPIQYGTIVNMLRPDSMYYYKGIIAAKSGWIEMSGFTLVTAAKRDGRTLICVEMKGDSWDSVYKGAAALFDYGFSLPVPAKTTSAVNGLSAGLSSFSKPKAATVAVTKPVGNSMKHVINLIALSVGALLLLVCVGLVVLRVINVRRRRRRRHEVAMLKVKTTVRYGTDDSTAE